ncbi:MAG: ImmA/IrrE family metallo-endopeptidase [bacterium]
MANALGPSRLASPELLAQTDALAGRVLAASGVSHPPVPENIVLYLGPETVIEYFDWTSLIGAVTHVGGRWVFGINRNDPPGRRRFTLMHEFKHALDGLRTVRDYRSYRKGMPKPLEEYLADRFAVVVLMPEEWVRAAARYERRVERLAWRFGVSAEAMTLRLRELGLPVLPSNYEHGRQRRKDH